MLVEERGLGVVVVVLAVVDLTVVGGSVVIDVVVVVGCVVLWVVLVDT